MEPNENIIPDETTNPNNDMNLNEVVVSEEEAANCSPIIGIIAM